MRLPQLHSDFIEYEPIEKEIRDAEEIQSKSKVRLEDLVVAFVAVENGDDENVARAAADEIKKYLDTVKAGRLLVYPYAHLSSDLAPPAAAAELVKSVERAAKDYLSEVYRAPFGWTKSFQIKVKGHPLAENAKVISKQVDHEHSGHSHAAGESESSALRAEEKLQSMWHILLPGGEMIPVKEYKFKKQDQNLQMLANYEITKNRAVSQQPEHVRLMKKLA
ncbi:MAG: threonyl-tRNA synthetase editing domain-containing protein, partial [Nitrososphaera sp.]